MSYGFIKVAAVTPQIRVADCDYNSDRIIEYIKIAEKNNCSVAVFPELCISGYTCSDLFLQELLLKSSEQALAKILESTKELEIISLIGIAVPLDQSLYNACAVCLKGKLLGLVPKINIPNYSEFYEHRHFDSGYNISKKMVFAGQETLLDSNVVFTCKNNPALRLGVEICEDLWVPNSPSVMLSTVAGATVIANPSASGESVGKAQYRRDLVKIQSAKLVSAYVYANSGYGESTTDSVYGGHNIICENGVLLSESKCFTTGITYADIDLERILHERRRITSYKYNEKNDRDIKQCEFELSQKDITITRDFPKNPFVPSDKNELYSRCEEILTMQATGLATRLEHTGIKNVVLGLSGGLDSTLALLVCVKAYDMLSLDRKNIHTVTMPCFGTTKRTKSNAYYLAQALGVDFCEIDITKAVKQHFIDINHDENIYDVTYENSQARERTQVLMDLSNKLSALVIGTGDLSELALGWATYNGDQMSMYGVNASVPKTLVRHLVAFEAEKSEGKLKEVLFDILDTPVSPELLPPSDSGEISQKTENLVGPYELHDYFMYYFLRFGYSPKKIYLLACNSFSKDYSEDIIKKWLEVFIRRFFTQQFKRSCMPDGVKIGSVGLSPRGDFRMPSDASVKLWLEELSKL